jgi:hypothetical protein
MAITAGEENWWPSDCLMGPGDQVYTLYIYLENPVNPSYDGAQVHPVTEIGGFECKLTATEDAILLDRRFPVDAIDVGQGDTMIVGFGQPVPVDAEGVAVVAEIDVFLGAGDGAPKSPPGEKASPLPCDSANAFLWMDPAYPPSIPDHMAYLDANDPDNDPLVPAFRRYSYEDWPDFMMESTTVASESSTWDGVKAIYR